jgi:hypothetical protein
MDEKKSRGPRRLPAGEAERREAAAVDYFNKNPQASPAKVNAAFQDGTLTGKREPTMNVKKLYKLRDNAQKGLVKKDRPPTIPAAEYSMRKNIGAEAVAVKVPFGEGEKLSLETLTRWLQTLPESFTEVVVRRDGTVRLTELERRERAVSL